METWYWYLIIGLACGILSALFGIGSGAIMIPILVLGLAFPQKVAQGTALAVMVPMALMGAIRYQMNPDIDLNWRLIGLLAAGGVVGALVGASLAAIVPGTLLRKLFAVLLLFVAVHMFFSKEGQSTSGKKVVGSSKPLPGSGDQADQRPSPQP